MHEHYLMIRLKNDVYKARIEENLVNTLYASMGATKNEIEVTGFTGKSPYENFLDAIENKLVYEVNTRNYAIYNNSFYIEESYHGVLIAILRENAKNFSITYNKKEINLEKIYSTIDIISDGTLNIGDVQIIKMKENEIHLKYRKHKEDLYFEI